MSIITMVGVGVVLSALCGFWFALEAEASPFDGLADRLLGRRRSRLFAVIASAEAPTVAVPACEPKARVTEVWQSGWKSIQAEPAPLLLTYRRPVLALPAPVIEAEIIAVRPTKAKKALGREKMTVAQLRAEAKAKGLKVTVRMKKAQLVEVLAAA